MNELDIAALADLISDAEQSEEQAKTGPFYPEKGITSESLIAYAKTCREKAARYKDGGGHASVLSGQ